MRTNPLPLALLLASAVATGAPPALAAPATSFLVVERAASDHADELLKRGLSLAKADQPAQAEPLLREAWGLKRSWDIAGNLGIVEVTLGKWREAAEHLTYAFKTFPTSGKPEQKKLLEQTLTKVLAQVTALTIKVSVDKAEVLVDGKSVGTAPVAEVVFVEAGVRKVEARLAGYETATSTVEAVKGGTSEVTLEMREVTSSPPPTPPEPTPPRARGPMTQVLVAGGVTAGAALVAGVAFTLVANGKAGDAAVAYKDVVTQQGPMACAQASAPGCTDLHALIGQKSALASAAAWTFIGSGVVGAGTLVYALAAPRAAPLPVQIAPAITGQQGGLIVRGAW